MKLNNRGSITVDYLFAFFLVSGFSMIIITFSTTLSMVEVVQYMTFAAARTYFAGNMTESSQKQAAIDKFLELKQNPAVSALLSGGWFSVPNDGIIVDRDFTKRQGFTDYTSALNGSPDHNMFEGVVVTFNASILNFQVPFFGSTQKSDAGNAKQGFTTNITAFLGREPTFDDCEKFNEARWNQIKNLPTKGAAPYSQAGADSDKAYVVINDNGC